MVERYIALTPRPTHSDRCSEHYQVHSGEVRIGTIYHTRTRPDGKEWFWGINGVLHGPLVFNGFAMIWTMPDASWLTVGPNGLPLQSSRSLKLRSLATTRNRLEGFAEARATGLLSIFLGRVLLLLLLNDWRLARLLQIAEEDPTRRSRVLPLGRSLDFWSRCRGGAACSTGIWWR